MSVFSQRLNASSLISPKPTLSQQPVFFFFPPSLCCFSPQDTEPEQDSHGCSGHLQFVLYAALAVRPVCAAHSGKQRARETLRVWEERRGGREITEKIETLIEQDKEGAQGVQKKNKEGGKTERKCMDTAEITQLYLI